MKNTSAINSLSIIIGEPLWVGSIVVNDVNHKYTFIQFVYQERLDNNFLLATMNGSNPSNKYP